MFCAITSLTLLCTSYETSGAGAPPAWKHVCTAVFFVVLAPPGSEKTSTSFGL